jgi:hypothetical protein
VHIAVGLKTGCGSGRAAVGLTKIGRTAKPAKKISDLIIGESKLIFLDRRSRLLPVTRQLLSKVVRTDFHKLRHRSLLMKEVYQIYHQYFAGGQAVHWNQDTFL